MEYEYELYHHGVKGMKWGVRRTKAQLGYKISKGFKKASRSVVEKVKASKAKKQAQKEAARKASKSVKDMTDSELRERINRLVLEQRALDLERQIASLSPQKVSVGKKYASELGGKFISSLGSAASKVAGEYLERQLKDSLGLNKKESDPLKKLRDEHNRLDLESKIAKAKKEIKDYTSEPAKPADDPLKNLRNRNERLKLESEIAKSRQAITQVNDYYEKRKKKKSGS